MIHIVGRGTVLAVATSQANEYALQGSPYFSPSTYHPIPFYFISVPTYSVLPSPFLYLQHQECIHCKPKLHASLISDLRTMNFQHHHLETNQLMDVPKPTSLLEVQNLRDTFNVIQSVISEIVALILEGEVGRNSIERPSAVLLTPS